MSNVRDARLSPSGFQEELLPLSEGEVSSIDGATGPQNQQKVETVAAQHQAKACAHQKERGFA
jgi:hypothetical protein